MHNYAADSNESKLVPFLLATVSILASWGLYNALGALQLTIPWWFDAPSVMGFYGLCYNIFDRRLWRIPIIRKIGLVSLPNLNGNWKGYLLSSFDEHGTKYDASIEIIQSWTRIIIKLRTEKSKSHSIVATLTTENPGGIILSYAYLNEPKANAKKTMHIHKGTAWLTLDKNGEMFEGEYYTGRDRQSYGSLHFERFQKI
jgi:hypothetical protein